MHKAIINDIDNGLNIEPIATRGYDSFKNMSSINANAPIFQSNPNLNAVTIESGTTPAPTPPVTNNSFNNGKNANQGINPNSGTDSTNDNNNIESAPVMTPLATFNSLGALDGVYLSVPAPVVATTPATDNSGSSILIIGIGLASLGIIAGLIMHFKEKAAA